MSAPLAEELVGLTAAFPVGGDPPDAETLLALLRRLHGVGRCDLPLGRLFEGHVDAMQIVTRYGAPGQVEALRGAVRAGARLGVWNADLAGEPLRLEGDVLAGGKSFASGAGLLTHALVTADTPGGRQLLLIGLAEAPPQIDRDWWRTLGMQRSETHRVRWSGVRLPPEALIGSPGDYAREPWFSGGALRFVAVQAGGVAALFDRTRDHLVTAGRADDPFQAARLAELFTLAQGAADAVRHAAHAWFADENGDEDRLAHVAAARLQVAEAAERALATAQQAVGLQGLFLAHPLSAVVADLTVYLRQPAPDAQRLRVGRAVAGGRLSPRL